MRATVPRFTLQDLDSFPDDGNRYELVDGILLVTPAPLLPHDVVVMRLMRILTLHLGPEPVAWVSGHGVVEVAPDLHLEPAGHLTWVPPAGPGPLVVDVPALFESPGRRLTDCFRPI